MVSRWWAAVAGAVAAAAAVAAGELVAALLSPSVSPLTGVGSAVIDLLPPEVKDWAVSLFGTADKLVFVIAMSAVILLLGAAAGLLEARWPPAGLMVFLAFAILGAAAVQSRPQAGQLALAAPFAAGAVGMAVLRLLISRLRAATEPGRTPGPPPERRTFLAWLGGTAAVTALATVAAVSVRSWQQAAVAARGAFRLPVPASAAPPLPAAASLPVPGITPLVTPSPNFYRIDTALIVPVVEAGTWRLRVTGLVEQEVELDFAELTAQPLIERFVTLCCVSNQVGGGLIGNARWLGWPVRELLARARPHAAADMVLSRSVDGFTASTPLQALADARDAMLAVGMNGEPLPLEHGYPVRLVVPGLYGYVSATKWVTELKLTRFADEAAYWTQRGWSSRGPVKLSSRIDTPRGGARLAAGTVTVAGVAWAQHTGISGVQLRIDDGPWQPADLGAAISADTWRQYRFAWPATAGSHTLQVRAIDAAGGVQTGEVSGVLPDGATGWHTITVEVEAGH